MEPRIKNRYGDNILNEARRRYGIDGDMTLLDGFESFIYTYHNNGTPYVLRVGHTLRNSAAYVRGEADFLKYLAAGGVSVAGVVPSTEGRLVEEIPDGEGECFLATAFTWAPGKGIWEVGGWTPRRYEVYGELLGKLHALSRDYRPADPAIRRPHWDEPRILDYARNLPASEEVAIGIMDKVVEHLETLPRTPESYGLTHFDAHAGNFFIEDETITLFDFEDCAYCWFAHDIAITLFYLLEPFAKDKPALTAAFMPPFLTGYTRYHPVQRWWLDEMPHFLKLREIDTYGVIYRSFDVTDLPADGNWLIAYMDGRKEHIESGEPVVEYDFSQLAEFCTDDRPTGSQP